MARIFGAPLTVPAGNVSRIRAEGGWTLRFDFAS